VSVPCAAHHAARGKHLAFPCCLELHMLGRTGPHMLTCDSRQSVGFVHRQIILIVSAGHCAMAALGAAAPVPRPGPSAAPSGRTRGARCPRPTPAGRSADAPFRNTVCTIVPATGGSGGESAAARHDRHTKFPAQPCLMHHARALQGCKREMQRTARTGQCYVLNSSYLARRGEHLPLSNCAAELGRAARAPTVMLTPGRLFSACCAHCTTTSGLP